MKIINLGDILFGKNKKTLVFSLGFIPTSFLFLLLVLSHFFPNFLQKLFSLWSLTSWSVIFFSIIFLLYSFPSLILALSLIFYLVTEWFLKVKVWMLCLLVCLELYLHFLLVLLHYLLFFGLYLFSTVLFILIFIFFFLD